MACLHLYYIDGAHLSGFIVQLISHGLQKMNLSST